MAVAAVPLTLPVAPASLQEDEDWVAELRSIVESGLALPPNARRAVRRVVEALVEDCPPSQVAEATALLRRL